MDPNTQYSFAAPRRQLFSLPPDVIKSMLDNPSSHKGLMKLYQTCKYFYGKRPILIADWVHLTVSSCCLDEKKGAHLDVAGRYVSHLQTPIWITSTVRLCGSYQNQLLPQFFRYSVKNVFLSHAVIQFKEFLRMTTEKNVYRFRTDRPVYHPDMSKTTIEEILQHLPNIYQFSYIIDEQCSLEVLTKLNAMKFKNKLEELELKFEDVHPSFDMNLFCEFVMKNSGADSYFYFTFTEATKEKLKLALDHLDPKWKNEAHEGMKRMFRRIDPGWTEE